MALTKAQLKEVLDKVYNNGQSYETYENDSFNGIKLYINDVEGNENTTILTRKEDDNTYIVAIFPTKSWVYTEGAEEKVYKCRVINDDMIISEVSNIYARGVGAYIKRLTYIKNICVFLGIKLSKNFDKENPVIYQDLSDICDKWFNTGKAPYFIGRYDRDNVPNYSTYVQYGVIKDICLYFNQLGVYRGSASMDLCAPQFFNYFDNTTTNIADFPTFEEFYETVDKETYYKRLKAIILYKIEDSSSIVDKDECANSIINLLDLQYGSEINFTNLLCLYISIGNSAKYPFTLRLRSIDKTCRICFSSASPFVVYNGYSDNDFSITTYEIIKQSDNTITHNKSVTSKQAETFHSLYVANEFILNLKCNKLLKLYCGETYLYESSGIIGSTHDYYGYPVEYNSRLSSNITYSIGDQIKLLDERLLLCSNNIRNNSFYYFMQKNNIHLGKKDLFLILSTQINSQRNFLACIIKDINTFKITSSDLSIQETSKVWLAQVYYKYYEYYMGTRYPDVYLPILAYIRTQNYSPYFSLVNDRISLDASKECYIYNMNTFELMGDMTLSKDFKYEDICLYVGATLESFYGLINLGEFINYESPASLNGLSIIEGSTLPNTVIDEPSFNTFLNSINAKRNPIRNPYYIKDELQDSTNLELWVQCTVYDTPPTTQAEAVDNDIDDMPEEEVENLEDDIESSTEGDDEDEDENNDDGKDDATDSGEVEEIPAEFVPNTLIGSLRQYKMNASEMINFSAGLSALDFSDVVQALIYGNPINGVVNMVTTYDGLWNSINSIPDTQVKVWNNDLNNSDTPVTATLVTQPIKEIDLGTINLATNTEIQEFIHDNYTDLTDCEIGLYLPFVGIINIDIHDFYKKELTLKARVDSTTGTIIYNVYSEGSNFKHLIYTCSGNCQSKIPLKSEDMSQLLRNIGNATAGVGGAILGGIV